MVNMTIKEMRDQINAIYEKMGTKYLEGKDGLMTDFQGHVQWEMNKRRDFFPSFYPSGKGMKKVHVEAMLQIVMDLYEYFTAPVEAVEVQVNEPVRVQEAAAPVATDLEVMAVQVSIQVIKEAMKQARDDEQWEQLNRELIKCQALLYSLKN